MTQLKVFEFAKEIGVETLVLMDKIREWKLPVRSHMATLDDELMAEIRQRLTQTSSPGAKPKKKTVRKKPVEAAPTAVARPVTKKTVAAAAAKAAAPPPESAASEAARNARSSVIRRKAGEIEARAEAAALAAAEARAAAEAEAAAYQQQQQEAATQDASAPIHAPSSFVSGAPAVGPSVAASGTAPVGTPGAAPGAPPAPAFPQRPDGTPRRNIVGRMDLRRVANISGNSGGSAGPGQPRVSRTAPRNIRPGFYSADSSAAPPAPTFGGPIDHAAREREERAKRRPGVGANNPAAKEKEEEVKIFTATEFRKREVIFQPKKKKSMISRDAKKTQITTPAAHKRVVKIDGSISLSALANELGIKAPMLVKKLMQGGVSANMNSTLDFDTVALLVPEFGWEAQNTARSVEELITATAFGELDAESIIRPPVVTVMGHVDHGKTSLLDSIRKADVAKGEAGGITQHIGAYSVMLDSGARVTFLDTPGHEAFTAMRARGANATDIAVIVVAADDGMMPQTTEAVNHAKAAGVPIIVAINKMDKPGANPDRIKQQLTELELVPEEWGGTTIFVPVSALKGDGITELLEQILLVAEVQELKANPKRSGTGVVIEARIDKGRGPVATVLVQDGTVQVGQVIVAGRAVGRVRSMMDDTGKVVKEATPGMPVQVLGLPEVPMAGDRFDVARDDESARSIAQGRAGKDVVSATPHSKMTLEQLFSRVKTGDTKELALIVKADVSGSLEAIKGTLDKLGNEEVKLKLIHSGVGGISESDVLLAGTSKGVIVGFNVRPDGGAMRMAKEQAIEIKTYSVIYEMMDDLKKSLAGMLAPTVIEKSVGRAEVRNIFVVPKMGTIAGSFVTDGKIVRNGQLRLVRDGKIVYEGKVASLRRFKDDAREVASGFECGIGIENFNDLKVGDVIESFTREEQSRGL